MVLALSQLEQSFLPIPHHSYYFYTHFQVTLQLYLDWSQTFGGNLLSNSNLDWSFSFEEKRKPTQYPHLHINTWKHTTRIRDVKLEKQHQGTCPYLSSSAGMSSYWPWPRITQTLVKYFQRQDAQLHQAPCVPLMDSFYIWEVSLLNQNKSFSPWNFHCFMLFLQSRATKSKLPSLSTCQHFNYLKTISMSPFSVHFSTVPSAVS